MISATVSNMYCDMEIERQKIRFGEAEKECRDRNFKTLDIL